MVGTASMLRERWAEGRPVFGLWAAMACPFAAELMSLGRVDYVCVDQQHGVVDYTDLVPMVSAIDARGAVPLTRVPANQDWLIGKSLDGGVQGVVVPLVSNGEEAEAAVAACRYPPRGVRSFGPIRSAVSMGARDTATLGDSLLCFVMVETREALEKIDQIASTPGLDGIYIGPADLALGLGIAPDLDKQDPEHVAAVEHILVACKRNGIAAGIQCGSGRSAHQYAEDGFDLITFGKDSALLQSAVSRELAATRGEDLVISGQGGYT